MMNTDGNNKRIISNQEFSQSINKYSLTFINPNYEKEFLTTKFEKKNILVMIGISIYFTMIIMGLRFIQGNLKNILDVLELRSTDPNLVSAFLWNCPLAIEGIIYFIQRIHICRGFFFNIFPMCAIVYFSNCLCLAYKTLAPLYIPISIMYAMMAIVICFIYAANWICGAIQIIVLLGILDYHLIIFDWSWIINKSILIPLSISTAFTIILAIYYFEYFQRKSVFMRLQAEEQMENMKQIIENLPDPIILGKEGNVVYKNNAFNTISITTNNRAPSRLNVIEEEKEEVKQIPEIKVQNLEENTHRQMYIQEEGINLLEAITHKSNSIKLQEFIHNNQELNSECFEIKYLDDIKAIFEITSVILNKGGQEMTMYVLKNLTHYHLINKLKERETFLRVYFASLTHDFRKPLGIIMGNVEILKFKINDDHILKYLRIIYNSGSILSLLVQDVLDYSQVKSGTLKMALINFSINKEFGLLIELFESKFEDKGLYLELEIDGSVPLFAYNDKNRIKQVLLNLISNAFKFTTRGGVKILVTSENNKKMIIVTVQDTGVGIKEEDLSKLFKEFGRIEGHEDLNPNGIGLGLHICKNLVENLGGTINVTSILNKGSRFTFSFTNIAPSQISIRLAPRIKSQYFTNLNNINVISPKTSQVKDNIDMFGFFDQLHLRLNPDKKNCNCSSLLIVEDEIGIRNVIKNFCMTCEIPYDEAENGQIALELVGRKLESSCCKYYKLILTDFNMPLMDGIKSSVLIKKELKHFHENVTKIVLVSGLSEEDLNNINNLDDPPFERIESKPLSFAKFKELTQMYIFDH